LNCLNNFGPCNIFTRNIDIVNDEENTGTDEENSSILSFASLNDSDSNTLNEDSSHNIFNDLTFFYHNFCIPRSTISLNGVNGPYTYTLC